MKAFIVSIAVEAEVVVLAATEADAVEIASFEAEAILTGVDAEVCSRKFDPERHQSFMSELPFTSDGESDRTLQEMIESKEVVL